jgi:heme-degrading monooxygenase HmoA
VDTYGPEGVWARFFAEGEGFVGTELTRDRKDRGCYLTLDFWESNAAYETFREANAAEYGRIDGQCEALTVEEKLIGYFEKIL